MITKFVRTECNRVLQEELIDTKFADFDGGLVTAFSRYRECVKMHTFPMGRFISLVLETQVFSLISLSNGGKSSEKVLFVIVLCLATSRQNDNLIFINFTNEFDKSHRQVLI